MLTAVHPFVHMGDIVRNGPALSRGPPRRRQQQRVDILHGVHRLPSNRLQLPTVSVVDMSAEVDLGASFVVRKPGAVVDDDADVDRRQPKVAGDRRAGARQSSAGRKRRHRRLPLDGDLDVFRWREDRPVRDAPVEDGRTVSDGPSSGEAPLDGSVPVRRGRHRQSIVWLRKSEPYDAVAQRGLRRSTETSTGNQLPLWSMKRIMENYGSMTGTGQHRSTRDRDHHHETTQLPRLYPLPSSPAQSPDPTSGQPPALGTEVGGSGSGGGTRLQPLPDIRVEMMTSPYHDMECDVIDDVVGYCQVTGRSVRRHQTEKDPHALTSPPVDDPDVMADSLTLPRIEEVLRSEGVQPSSISQQIEKLRRKIA